MIIEKGGIKLNCDYDIADNSNYPKRLKKECEDCPYLVVFKNGENPINYCIEFGRLYKEKI